MRKILSPILSLFTAIGGHLLNRRLDLALLFFALLILCTLFAMYGVPVAMRSSSPVAMFRTMGYSTFLLLGLLLIISAMTSFIQASKATEREKLGGTGKVAGLLTVVLSIAIIGWTSLTGRALLSYAAAADGTVPVTDNSKESGATISHISYFHETARYGGKWIASAKLSPIPQGKAYISGKVTYQGKPAAVALKVVLNNRYQSHELTTDSNGIFRLPLPAGEWTVNRIELTQWKNCPNGKTFNVTTGTEAALENGMYLEGPNFDSEGLKVSATTAPKPNPALTIIIHDDPVFVFPHGEKVHAKIKRDSFKWTPVKNASHYQLQLHRVERNGMSTSYYPVTWVNTRDVTVALKDFATVPDQSGEEHEYEVKLYAFDDKGKLLSSNEFMSGNSIILKGVKLVNKRQLDQMGDTSGLSVAEFNTQVEASMQDRKRIEAAKTLLEEEMPKDARVLLEKVTSPSLIREKNAALGMVLAAEGRCKEARKIFADPSAKCMPEFVSKRCPE